MVSVSFISRKRHVYDRENSLFDSSKTYVFMVFSVKINAHKRLLCFNILRHSHLRLHTFYAVIFVLSILNSE